MTRPPFHRKAFAFAAGRLGYVEALTIFNAVNKSELCHYVGGIPYARSPVGQLRFRRPRPLVDGTRFGRDKSNPARFGQKAKTCPQPGQPEGADTSDYNEDCLQLNLYFPAGKEVPAAGWPVFFFIHGGFLQWGSPNQRPEALACLLSETAFEAIIVMPGYRLNLFGFLSGEELQDEAERDGEAAGNMGFWDQRAALEWTAQHIGHFGGDPSNITVGGYSAGAHSAFHQLAHELYFVPDEQAVIKRTIMWSNSPGVQPRTYQQHQAQFDELLSRLDIPRSLSADEKLRKLRKVPVRDLVDVQDKMKISEYRATSDKAFVSKDLIANINGGDFARRMKARNVKLMNGECRDEHFLYGTWRAPSRSYDAVRVRLIADYPEEVVNTLMSHYCGGSKEIPSGVKDWHDLFGRIYADMQVHCLERGFQQALVNGGLKPGTDLLRYRIEWRAACVADSFPKEFGVTHATDMAIWFWGLDYGEGLSDDEKAVLGPVNKAFAAFVKGKQVSWDTKTVRQMKRLGSDGTMDVCNDELWAEGLKLWALVNDKANAGQVGSGPIKARL